MQHAHSRWLGWFALGAGALGLLGIVGAPAVAQPTGSPVIIDLDPVESTIARDKRVVYHLVGKRLRVASYDNHAVGTAVPPIKTFDQAITNDAAADLRFILFENAPSIGDLSAGTLQMLLDKFENGEWIIGAKGPGQDLKAALGLLDPALKAPPRNPGLAVFVHRSPAGHLNELTIAAPSSANGWPPDDDSVEVAFDAARDWHESNTATLAVDEAWKQISSKAYSSTMTGVYRGNTQTVGTYKFTITMYYMRSDNTINDVVQDWYRADFQTISNISNYKKTGDKFGDTKGKCGWWTKKVHAPVTVLTTNGQWWEYMPDTFVGSSSTSYSIGGSLSTSALGISGGYSKTYGTSDVEIVVRANSVEQSIGWTSKLRGCGDYGAYPAYRGASKAAKSTYNLYPSLIMAVPEGRNLSFRTQKGGDYWRIVVEKDRLKCGFACSSLKVTEYTSSVGYDLTINCSRTAC